MSKAQKYGMYVEIAKRAEESGLYTGERLSLLMDIESADEKFNLRLEEWLAADDFNFIHDLYGIMDHIVRDKFPADDLAFLYRDSQVDRRQRHVREENPQV